MYESLSLSESLRSSCLQITSQGDVYWGVMSRIYKQSPPCHTRIEGGVLVGSLVVTYGTRSLFFYFLLLMQVLEARALYNLGNIYHAKGKHAGRSFHQDPGNFPEEVRVALEKAAEFYEYVNLLVSVGCTCSL